MSLISGLIDDVMSFIPPESEDVYALDSDHQPMFLSTEELDAGTLALSDSNTDGVYTPTEVNDVADMQALIDASVTSALAADGSNAEAEAAQAVALAEIADTLSTITTPSFISLSSAQCLYFEGILSKVPFSDYSVVLNNSNDYSLFYGYNLSAGDDCSYVRVYRSGSGYDYNYVVEKGEITLPDISAADAVVSTYLPNCAVFPAVEEVKHETFFSLGLCVALAFCVLRSILFR